MAGKFISMRNLRFLLDEVFAAADLTKAPYFSQYNAKTFKMVLDEALQLGTKLLHPIFEEMDREPPELADGNVKVHSLVKKIITEFGKNGWITAGIPMDQGGEQMPLLITNSCNFIFAAANYSASVYQGLSAGAARLILSFGSDGLKKQFVEKITDGSWQGTMALTEPEAGSSLSDITTCAAPASDGTYRIKGGKIFISAGDHDGVENVVHLTLAKIEGAPPGVKGISLFAVPKYRPDGKDGLVSNDVTVTQIFHKMGYRGAPITELSFGDGDDCRGYLVGEPNKGLAYMFQMMNEARLGVGIGAAGIASAAYYAALEYTGSRLQGRSPGSKDPLSEQIPIIEHADVRRMLLFQRAVVEGGLSLLLQCSQYEDMQHVVSGEEKEKYFLLLDLLTPVAKSWPSEMGILSTSQSIQCFGGYGYCDDFPVEQHFRDMRIHPIHEGTTGIQAMDLLGRKLTMKNGKAFFLFADEIKAVYSKAGMGPDLLPLAEKLKKALETLEKVTSHLMVSGQTNGAEIFLADAVLYLELFANVTVAWQWLKQAAAAETALQKSPSKADTAFYKGKIFTCRYFFAYELPKISGLAERLTADDPLTIEMKTDYFTD